MRRQAWGGGQWDRASKKKQKQLPTGMAFLPVAHLSGLAVPEDKGKEGPSDSSLDGQRCT